MFSGIRSRFIASFLLFIITTTGILGISVLNEIREYQIDMLRQRLTDQLYLIHNMIQPDDFIDSSESLQMLVSRLAVNTDTRIAITDSDGEVLADSEYEPASIKSLSVYSEIKGALSGKLTDSIRRSTITGINTMYVAAPITLEEQVIGICLVSLPLTALEDFIDHIGSIIGIAAIIMVLIAVILAIAISRTISIPLRQMTTAAQNVADGISDSALQVGLSAELGGLARAINSLGRKKNETIRSLKTDSDRMKAIIANAADGVLVVDARGDVTMINPAAARILNLNASIAEGHPFIEMVRDHEIASILQECIRSGAPHSGLIETEPDKKLLGIMATSLGNNAGTVVLLQDLTKLRQLERVRSDFVANISHELRTPLTSLKLLTETLQSGNLVRTKHALSFLGKMDAEVDILIQMVNELAELSSIESGREKLDLSLLDITVVSSQIVDRLMEQVQRANLTLELDFPPDLPMVKADRRKMEQVIVNLLHNAIKFTPSGGIITISACKKEKELCFSVKDTGIGIPREDLTRIFERFYKVDRARTGPGTGLGLSIVKHIIEVHSGRVWVESTEGRGAVFTFCIPLLLKNNK